MSKLRPNITIDLDPNGFKPQGVQTGTGIHHLIENVAKHSPDAVAIVDSDQRSLTYSEVNVAADRVADQLQKAGVQKGEMVAIAVGRSCEMAIGILGILRSGGAYVPLDPEYPSERLEYILNDSSATVLLVEPNEADSFVGNGRKIVILDSNTHVDSKVQYAGVDHLEPDDPAYVIYTSGTTGTPKGVVITHRNLRNYVATLPNALGLERGDRYLHTASISFSSSVRQLMLPLSIGATVVIASSSKIKDPRQLFEFIKRERVTVLDFVPSYWRSCIQVLESDAIANSSVRVLLSASEPLKKEVAEQLMSMLGQNARMINMYGQTETTGIVFVSPLSKEKAIRTPVVPIGLPIENASAYILNADLSQVKNGEIGELYVGGAGVGRGYLNRPEMTADRFIRDQFSVDGNALLYRTGDLARSLPTGEIEHLGRSDDLVKVRGFRVELGEIESVACQFDDVLEAVVVATEEPGGDKRLVAYVVSRTESKIGRAELRKYLRRKLPEYMVPSAYVQLERLPLTPNGKIDRKALPAPERDISAERDGYEAPRTDTEKKLAETWSGLLGVDNIGINDKFVELGGHSLLAVQMFLEVEKTFRKNIPLATLFEAGTIAKLAEILSQDNWSEPESSLVPIQPKGNRLPFYVMHAVGGNVMFYSDLAKYLHPYQPLFGLQARRLAGRQIGHATIEEMAEFYIEEIIQYQPVGPYCLGGSSFGGLIAYEMARQLLEQGKEVGILALFDTSTPEYKEKLTPGTTKLSTKINKQSQRVQLHLDNLRILTPKDKTKYLLSKSQKGIAKYRRNARNMFKKAARQMYTRFKGKSAIPKSYIQLEDQLVRARKKFKPKPFPGKAILFRASIQPYGLEPDPLLGWDKYLAELEAVEVHGHHTSIVVEPYAQGLAELLNSYLESLNTEFLESEEQVQRENSRVVAT